MKMLRYPAATAATPLLSLTAVSLDTEATSLDVKTSRIIEVGAIGLVNGAVRGSLSFESFVNPGVAIPAGATAVHGIRDRDLAGAPAFRKVWRNFRHFSANHVLLGYALDFDLALLEREHARENMAWKGPPAVDVRSLVRILHPMLPDHSLDTVAGWLGVEVNNRHRAKGDAIVTAQVYLALVPLLRGQNIRTLGEAMAVCRKLEQAGAEAMPLEATGRLQVAAMARADSFPYRHRVDSVMAAPPSRISAEAPLAEAMNTMVERKISSLFVEPRAGRGAWGILTERDVMRAITVQRGKSFSKEVGEFASWPLKTVHGHDFLYVAIGLMRRLRVRHLGVVDKEGLLVGAVSQRDLLRMRADEAIVLTGALSDAASPSELAGVWHKLADAARALVNEDVDGRDVAAIISSEVCALTARAASLSETEVSARHPRPTGLSYAVMVLGSGGRGESLLALDQDNAMVFECPDEAEGEAWLAKVAERMNAILDEIGVPLCKGGVMARNPQWRMSVADWRRQVDRWLSRNSPADIMNADIFFDSVAVHGDTALADDLRSHAIAAAAQSEAFLKLMSLAAADIGSPFNWFGRFAVDEQSRLDLKRLGIMPVFTAARVASLRYSIHERSTRARLAALRGNPDVPQHQIEALSEAHALLLGVILRQQLDDIDAGIPPSNRVEPKALSSLERDRLKWALQQVKGVTDLLGTPAG